MISLFVIPLLHIEDPIAELIATPSRVITHGDPLAAN